MRTDNAHGEYMRNLHSQQATKRAANLSLNSELLAEAKRLNINLSATMEKALEREVSKKLREEWADNNSEALDACNKLTEKFGLFSDSYRKF
jgi:antitoxin CcdA